MLKPAALRWTVPPGNNGFVIPFDSTRHFHGMTQGAIAAGSEFLAPGRCRGLFTGMGLRVSIRNGDQQVTSTAQILTGNAGTSADWETQGAAGTRVVALNTTDVFDFLPMAADFRLMIAAGATGPNSLVVMVEIVPMNDFGS